jgi:hypothetical protein
MAPKKMLWRRKEQVQVSGDIELLVDLVAFLGKRSYL